MKRYKHIWKTVLAGLTVVLATACTDELADSATGQLPLKPGDVALQLLPANMAIHNVSTRGTDPKTAAEQQINNIHVFIFDETGQYLQASGSDAFQGYRYQEGNTTMVLNRTLFENIKQDPRHATVVVLANMPKETFADEDKDAFPDGIDNLGALESYIFNLPTFSATLPESGLPMMVRKDDVNLAPDDGTTTGSVRVETLQMESLMARIDLNFSLEPAQASGSKDYPSLRFDAVRVGNFPKGGRVATQFNDATTETSGVGLQEATAVEQLADFTGRYIREGQPQTLTLYMFEHGRAAKALNEVVVEGEKPFPDGNYPQNITEAEKQRYKNWLADDEAAYIELEGIYTNHNDYKYKVTYRLYPGKDATADFTIKRNCQYKNNITVSGITVNGQGTEALLDTRVNIDTQANPYFIQMLREREHDAHFNVTPMDVYIYNGGSVKVEIVEPEQHKWIRMEPMKESPTAEGKIAAVNAGDGKRDYFTTDLVTNTLKNNTSYTVTYPTDGTGTHEERIYFYIDENVPDEKTNGKDIPDREAEIKITYTRPEGEEGIQTHTRVIPIRQAGMKLVNYSGNNISYKFYIEAYEEYLNHYDGKDTYNETYAGLEWGFEGILTGLYENTGWAYFPYGWRNTMTIMKQFRNTSSEKDDITLNDKPRGATEYCYNKNKRNNNGKVETCHWYHPSIREIEQAMDQHYALYKEFQNNWYWGSNPGSYGAYKDENNMNTGLSDKDYITWTGEHPEYARATRSVYGWIADENKYGFTHATSEANKPYAKDDEGNWDTPYNPDDWGPGYPQIGDPKIIDPWQEGYGGYARRTQVFRIRAAYILERPNDNAPTLDN